MPLLPEAAWTSHDTALVLDAVIAIAGIIALTTQYFGMSVVDTIKTGRSWRRSSP